MSGKSRALQALEAEDVPPLAQRLGIDPSRYHKALDRRAADYALLGATNEEIADLLGIHRASFDTWAVEKPSLRKALTRSRVDANVRLVKAMHRAGRGYKTKETKVFNVDGSLQTIDITKQYPPSVQAAQFVLSNRASKHWQDKRTVDHSGTVNLAALVDSSFNGKVIDAQPVEDDGEPTV